MLTPLFNETVPCTGSCTDKHCRPINIIANSSIKFPVESKGKRRSIYRALRGKVRGIGQSGMKGTRYRDIQDPLWYSGVAPRHGSVHMDCLYVSLHSAKPSALSWELDICLWLTTEGKSIVLPVSRPLLQSKQCVRRKALTTQKNDQLLKRK